MPKLHTFLPHNTRAAVLVSRDSVFVPSRARPFLERKSISMGWFMEIGQRVVLSCFKPASSRLQQQQQQNTSFDAPHACFDSKDSCSSSPTSSSSLVPPAKTLWWHHVNPAGSASTLVAAHADKRVSAWLSYQHHHQHHHHEGPVDLVPRRWSSVLATLCRAHVVDEELFIQTVASGPERKRLFGSVCPKIAAEHGNDTAMVESLGTLPSPLICLRRFFMFTESVERVEALFQSAGLLATKPVYPGSAYLDHQAIEIEKSNIYPYPLLTPHMWIIRQLSMPQGSLAFAPAVLERHRIVWETVVAPFASTVAVFDAACAALLHGPSDASSSTTTTTTKQDAQTFLPLYYDYDPTQCSFVARMAFIPADTAASVFDVPLIELNSTYNVPVPQSLLQLSRDLMSTNGGRVNLVHVAAAAGCSIVAAALFNLYHLHRLLFVSQWVDDRCLQHITQLMIDQYLPLLTLLCEHRQFFTDASLMRPAEQVVGGSLVRAHQPERSSKHPQAPNSLNEHAGVAATDAVEPLVECEGNPIVFFVWPASTRWLVTAEEAPSMANALSHLGLIQRTSDSYTAIQNWSDSSSTFIVFFLSKMWQIRNKTRADKQKAQRCGVAHPVFLTTLLYYWWLSQLGNIPGVKRRPAFTTRMRLYSTYCTSTQHSRDADWIVKHCFQTCRHSVRVSMYQLFGFYFNLVPALRNVIFSHPGRGLGFQEWFVAAGHQVSEIVRRLELVAFVPRAKEHVKEYQATFTNLLVKRLYDAVNRYQNPFMHAALYPTYLTELTMRILEQLVSRGGLTLRAFRAPVQSAAFTGDNIGAVSAGGESGRNAHRGGRRVSSSAQHREFDALEALEANTASAFSEVIAEHAAEERNGDADGADEDDTGASDGAVVAAAAFAESLAEEQEDVDQEATSDQASRQPAGGSVSAMAETDAAEDVGNDGNDNQADDEEDDDNDNDDDDDDGASTDADIEELAKALDEVLVTVDCDFSAPTDNTEESVASSFSLPKSSNLFSQPGMAQVGTLARPQMNSVVRHFLTSLIYVPFLDDPGQEEMARKFKQMCFIVQRYSNGNGSKQYLPVLCLGYFGLSAAGAEFLIQLRIFHEQCLPYNRVEILMSLFRLQNRTDFALVWRYLQYIRLFTFTQGMMLPAHIAAHQRRAREIAVFGSTLEAHQFYEDLANSQRLAVKPSPFIEATQVRLVEAVESCRFCETCRTWMHSLAPTASTQYVLPKGKTYFVARQTPSTTLFKPTRAAAAAAAVLSVQGAAAVAASATTAYSGQDIKYKAQEASSAIASADYLTHRGKHSTALTVLGQGRQFVSAGAVGSQHSSGNGLHHPPHHHNHQQQQQQQQHSYHYPARTYAFDFVNQRQRCTNDVRHRVTAGLTVLVSHTLSARGSGDTPFSKLNAEQSRMWKTFCALVQQFPYRPKQVESVVINSGELYPHLRDPEKRPRGVVVTAVTAAVQNPELLKKMEEEAMRKMQKITETGSDLAKRAITSNIYDPQLRSLLEGYFTGDPRVEDGVTAGMQHRQVLADARRVIQQAADAAQAQDRTFICNSSTIAINMIGRMISKPTHYTCLWENFVLCSVCGDMMKAFEWLYTPHLGWVCAKHPGVVRTIDPNAGCSGVYDARPCSRAPRSAACHTASQFSSATLAARTAAGNLAVQEQYFVSQASQINGIPPQWLDAHNSPTWYHAAGVAELVLRERECARVERAAWTAQIDPSTRSHQICRCHECDKQREDNLPAAASAETTESGLLYINTVQVVSLIKRGPDAGKVANVTLCQKHFLARLKADTAVMNTRVANDNGPISTTEAEAAAAAAETTTLQPRKRKARASRTKDL